MLRKLAILLLPYLAAHCMEYSVHFIGLDDRETLKAVQSASFLSTIKKKPPTSLNALRFRAESDIPDMIKVLHAHGYYDATIEERIEDEGEIFVMIQPGDRYRISQFKIEAFSEGKLLECPALENLCIEMGKPALTTEILDSEQKALAVLGECGYPLATIESQEIIGDYRNKTISVAIKIHAGPVSKYGSTTASGAPGVKQKVFENKISWKEGETYDTKQVEKTQKKLLDTGLFSSAIITHDSELGEKGELPMHIDVTETKHHSINFGLSYQTYFGPGLTFGWENRNISGLGRKFSLQGDVTARTHTGTATYFVPDFWKVDQDYVAQGQALQESILAYHQRAYSVTNRIERRIETKYRVSLGIKLERIIVSNSVKNGTFSLLEVPLYFRWSSTTDIFNPTHGSTFEYKAIPTINFRHGNRYYLYNSFVYTLYFPVAGESVVLAQQIMFDSILSRDLKAVPVPKRVLGGSDQELRGYRYHSVSPLHHKHKPIGGRSGIFYTFETRFRLSKTIGLVPFLDIGSVYLTPYPTFHEKWYKSVGLGFRYFTFLGPFRADVAFPLDRRRIDKVYRIIVSIGQAF